MRIRRHWPVVVVLLLMPKAALAHDHTADFFGAPSFALGSSLWGFRTSLAITLPPLNEDLSLLGDFSVHVGKHDGQDLTRTSFMGGARYTFTGTKLSANLVSVHVLIGGVHDAGTATSTDWALAVGGGWEYLPGGRTDKGAGGLAFRVQGDYVRNLSGGESFPRFSAGIVYRIPGR